MQGSVVAVSASPSHTFSKPNASFIRLIAGFGIEGDAHAGATVRHRARAARHPSQPNLRQVHLIHEELFADLAAAGFVVAPGAMGENVTTAGLDILSLPAGTRLRLGADAVVELTGLRDPCSLIDGLHPGLMQAVLDRDSSGNLVRKAGVMSIVIEGGEVRPGDAISVEIPAGPHRPLAPV